MTVIIKIVGYGALSVIIIFFTVLRCFNKAVVEPAVSLWTSGFYISTVGRNGNEETIQNYVENQDQNDKYVQLYKAQLRLFEGF